MASRVRNWKDFSAGVLYVIFGLGAIWFARDYAMGSAMRMGPGYFPTALGGLLALTGLIAIIRSFFSSDARIESFAFKPLLIVIASTLVFALLLRSAGIAVALPIFTLLGATASRRFRFIPALALAAGLTVFCILVFVKGLGIPLPILGPWFGD